MPALCFVACFSYFSQSCDENLCQALYDSLAWMSFIASELSCCLCAHGSKEQSKGAHKIHDPSVHTAHMYVSDSLGIIWSLERFTSEISGFILISWRVGKGSPDPSPVETGRKYCAGQWWVKCYSDALDSSVLIQIQAAKTFWEVSPVAAVVLHELEGEVLWDFWCALISSNPNLFSILSDDVRSANVIADEYNVECLVIDRE